METHNPLLGSPLLCFIFSCVSLCFFVSITSETFAHFNTLIALVPPIPLILEGCASGDPQDLTSFYFGLLVLLPIVQVFGKSTILCAIYKHFAPI